MGDVEPESTRTARVRRPDELPDVLNGLGLRRGRPVMVLVGGADGMGDAHLDIVRELLTDAVLPTIDHLGAAVVDGGTDAGAMRLVGQGRIGGDHRFPLVGVAAEGTVDLGGEPPPNPDPAPLEPHHTHVVLVPGVEWGDEAPWLGRVAEALADGAPTLTMVVNGGEITFDDIAASLGRSRPVLVLAGTGRTADVITAARTDHGTDPEADTDPRAVAIAAAPLTWIVPGTDHAAVVAVLEKVLITRPT